MLIHWVIGNGVSRKDVDIDKLKGVKYGCNAIYRDYWTDYLFSKDKPITFEIYRSGAWKDRRVSVQTYWRNDSEFRPIQNHISLWSHQRWFKNEDFTDTGTMALRQASHNAMKYLGDKKHGGVEIHMVGFDFDKTNIYSNTSCYHEGGRFGMTHSFVDTFELFPQLTYVQHGSMPDVLKEKDNVILYR